EWHEGFDAGENTVPRCTGSQRDGGGQASIVVVVGTLETRTHRGHEDGIALLDVEGGNAGGSGRNGLGDAFDRRSLRSNGNKTRALGDQIELVIVVSVEPAMPVDMLGIEVGNRCDVGGEVDISGL